MVILIILAKLLPTCTSINKNKTGFYIKFNKTKRQKNNLPLVELIMSMYTKRNSKQNCNQYVNNSLKEQKNTDEFFWTPVYSTKMPSVITIGWSYTKPCHFISGVLCQLLHTGVTSFSVLGIWMICLIYKFYTDGFEPNYSSVLCYWIITITNNKKRYIFLLETRRTIKKYFISEFLGREMPNP